MSRNSIKKEDEKTDINISPMIDMVFILLIFFIVTTVFVEEQGIEAERPTPGQQNNLQDENEPIKMRIAANGDLFCNDQKIQATSIRSKVAEILRKGEVPVIIDVEDGVASGKMIMVIDESRNGGADKVLVNTVQSKS